MIMKKHDQIQIPELIKEVSTKQTTIKTVSQKP